MTLSVLLTGATGYLGGPLLTELRERGAWVCTAGRGGADVPLDLEDPEGAARAVAAVVAAEPRTCVLHAGAMSRAGECAADPGRANRVNGEAAGRLAVAAAGRLLFVSTDLVFGGDRAPYGPGDPVDPRLPYGVAKALGERVVLDAGGAVVRLPLLYGAGGAGRAGAEDVVRAGLSGDVTLFTDEYRTPLHVTAAARGIVDLLEGDPANRVYHLPGPVRLSRYEHALQICAAKGWDGERLRGAPAPDDGRPKDVSLRG